MASLGMAALRLAMPPDRDCEETSLGQSDVLLSWSDLSFALPATALGSVVNTVGARFFLKENVTMGRWMGTLLICVGVSLLS